MARAGRDLRASGALKENEDGLLGWPIWDAKDIDGERWSATDGKGKDKAKWPFEDPAGPVVLPPLLQREIATTKRACELYAGKPMCVVSMARFDRVPAPPVLSEEEAAFARMKGLVTQAPLLEPEVSVVSTNTHLLQSELMRWLIAIFSTLQREPHPWDAHSGRPWELIYPQRDRFPYVNPGGKYAVKLFWLGSWRKILVDDSIPLDGQGRPLLLTSSIPSELWPLLLCKAVCRIATLTYDQSVNGHDFSDADLIQMLTGWISVTYTTQSDDKQLIAMLSTACTVPPVKIDLIEPPEPEPEPDEQSLSHSFSDEEDKAGVAYRRARSLSQTSVTSRGEKADTTSSHTSSRRGSPSRVPTPPAHVPAHTQHGSAGSVHGTAGPSHGSPHGSAHGSAHGAASGSAHASASTHAPASALAPPFSRHASSEGATLTPSTAQRPGSFRRSASASTVAAAAAPVSIPVNNNSLVYAVYSAAAPTSNSDVGLPGRMSHPVRVLSCRNVAALIEGRDDPALREDRGAWVLELESPFVLYTGPGGHNNLFPNARTWQAVLGTSFDRELAAQTAALALRMAECPHAPFRFRMLLSDFVTYFSTVILMQKSTEYHFRTTLLGLRDNPPLVTVDADASNKDQTAVQATPKCTTAELDMSQGRPWMLYCHSDHHTELVVCLCVAQARAPVWLDGKGAAEKTRPPEVGTFELEEYSWQSATTGKTYIRMSSTGTRAARVRLAPGRNVFRMLTYMPAAYSLTILADKEFVVGNELQILRHMNSCSGKFIGHATAVIKALKTIISKPTEESNEMMRHLASSHVTAFRIPPAALLVFWHAMVLALRQTLLAHWADPLPGLRESVGEAWTLLCTDLEKELSAAFATAGRRRKAKPTPAQEALSRADAAVKKKKLTRIRAATIVQAYFRGWRARLATHAMRAARINRLRGAVLPSFNTVLACPLEFCRTLFRRMWDISPEVLSLFPFSKYEAMHCVVRDLIATSEEHPEGYFVVSQDVLLPAEPVLAALRLHVPAAPEGVAIALHVFDNDTGEEAKTVFSQTLPTTLRPNRFGYTILVDGRFPTPVPPLRFGIRLISNVDLATDPSRGGIGALSTRIPQRDFTGPCKPSKDGLLFKCCLLSAADQPAAVQVSVRASELPGAVLRLDIFRDGVKIASQSGPLTAVIPFVFLPQSSEPLPGQASPVPGGVRPGAAAAASIVAVGWISGDFVLESDELSRRSFIEVPDAARDRSTRTSPKSEKKSKRDKERERRHAVPQILPLWTLRIFSKDTVVATSDVHREEEIASMKAAWEHCDPGRHDKGEHIRANYIARERASVASLGQPGPQPMHTETIAVACRPLTAAPSHLAPARSSIALLAPPPAPSPHSSPKQGRRSLPGSPLMARHSSPTILSPEALHQREEERERVVREYQHARDVSIAQRDTDRHAREERDKSLSTMLRDLKCARQSMLSDVNHMRTDYRKRVVEAHLAVGRDSTEMLHVSPSPSAGKLSPGTTRRLPALSP
eukprot:m.243568 g.243568  ORF g.243568 m.243568 type:complete len:1503 (+) comp14265_c0_seq1:2238-6746(+)